VIILIKKAYIYLKNDIENEKLIILIAEVIVFILLWCEFCFLYFTQPIYENCLYFIESSPIATAVILLSLSTISILLFIINSFCAGELIHRVREEMEKNKLAKSQKGWILIDSIVGMVILSTAVIALLLNFTLATRGTNSSTNRTQATYLAQQALETLKAQDGRSVILPQAAENRGIFSISSPTIAPVLAISGDAKNLSTYLKPYQVTVSWSDTTGGPANKSITMVGYCYVNP